MVGSLQKDHEKARHQSSSVFQPCRRVNLSFISLSRPSATCLETLCCCRNLSLPFIRCLRWFCGVLVSFSRLMSALWILIIGWKGLLFLGESDKGLSSSLTSLCTRICLLLCVLTAGIQQYLDGGLSLSNINPVLLFLARLSKPAQKFLNSSAFWQWICQFSVSSLYFSGLAMFPFRFWRDSAAAASKLLVLCMWQSDAVLFLLKSAMICSLISQVLSNFYWLILASSTLGKRRVRGEWGCGSIVIQLSAKMKQTLPKSVTKQSNKSESLSKSQPQKSISKKEVSKGGAAKPKYKIDAITKDNFECSSAKLNITEISELPLKYVLRCIEGLYKNRYIFITTHPEGEMFGSGDVKLYGLTLQIEGVGLAPKHAQLKYDGFKSFNVIDFGSESGTWMNIPQEGVQIKDGEHYAIGPYLVSFSFGAPINEIEEICMVYHLTSLSDVLEYNGIHTLSQLYAANYNNFEGYPLDKKDLDKLRRICDQTKNWYEQGRKYRRIHINYLNQPLKDFSIEIGWETFYVSSDPDFLFHSKNVVGEINKGRIIPLEKVFSRIPEGKFTPLSLHSQIKLGDLSFEMTRFNTGVGEDIGFRPIMEDGLLIEEDVGGSEWKLISLFAVLDGHGGPQCMKFIKDNLVAKVREWTSLLDEAGDLNQMVKVLMNKTFFELDFQFSKQFPELAMTCGCTAVVMLVIESKVYTFHVGDCKSYLFRNEVLYKMNIDHLPSRGDERNRIQAAGGFVQYDRLMGKCTLSRCFGQFEYKNLEDYENQLKGKLKSYLSCIPDMVCFDIKVDTDDFVILSTDGIFESMDIFQVTDFIKERYDKLELQENPNKIISGIIENCKIVSPQSDNMAVILMIIRKGELRA